ncbi:S1C family serine protease [Aneurinibacillus terranovensis]|uniref:S1C family serine protease n=1 Tax=Aneurinibacillus terranovensis TaxID=278991 RepID=UPI00040FF493|nr:trypsin-like peptidase domain-containing protein [Aneurinibacillus terranovensis]
MGFYNDEFNKKPAGSGKTKWISTVVLSALIGSASTAATISFMIKSDILPVSQSTVSAGAEVPAHTVPVSNVSVNINDGIVGAVKKIKPAIVGVVNYSSTSDFFNRNSGVQEQGEGSGIILDNQGHIVTNNHVVEGAAKVEVLLPNGKRTNASVIGTDKYSDLAVLQIPSSDVTGTAVLGNSDTLQVGEPAIAIGNPLGQEFNQTVTEGVISATNRMMPVTDEASGQTLNQQAVLQTDAAINPGNSGGALCNVEGQVIGINSSKISSTGVEGMGFAIPINEARQIITQILKSGHVNYPALGVSAIDLQQVPNQYLPNIPVNYGVFITNVQSSEASASGLQRGDVIVGVNGVKITDSSGLHSELFKYKVGDTVKVDVYTTDGKKQTLPVKLTALSTIQSNDTSGNGNGDNSNGIMP